MSPQKCAILGCIFMLACVNSSHGLMDRDSDNLDEIFGIKPADKASSSQSKDDLSSYDKSTVFESSNNFLISSIPGEFILYVDESTDVVVITCEVSLPSKDHSVHLLCPLVSENRLCFENCRRVCSLPDCTDKPKLFTVECVEDLFVRDMYNIWKFRYIIDRHDPAVSGSWGCFHAGKSTESVNITAILTTTAEPPRMPTTTIPIVERKSNRWSGSLSERLNSGERKSGGGEYNDTPASTTQSQEGKSKGAEFDRAVILVLVVFLAISILINVAYIFFSSCRRKKLTSEVRLSGLKGNRNASTVESNLEELQAFTIPPSITPPSIPPQRILPPVSIYPGVSEQPVSSSGSGLYLLHSNTLQPSSGQRTRGYLTRPTMSPSTDQPRGSPQLYKTIIFRPVTAPKHTSGIASTTQTSPSLGQQNGCFLFTNSASPNDGSSGRGAGHTFNHLHPHNSPSAFSSTCTENNALV